jgi:hypothetical protein
VFVDACAAFSTFDQTLDFAGKLSARAGRL